MRLWKPPGAASRAEMRIHIMKFIKQFGIILTISFAGEILNYLTLWYNVQFKFTGDVKLDERISGKIRQSEDVDNILIALQGVYHFKFKKTDDEHYEIY